MKQVEVTKMKWHKARQEVTSLENETDERGERHINVRYQYHYHQYINVQ